jgi:uncharacterized glyoxalase superfamily protein PhnB
MSPETDTERDRRARTAPETLRLRSIVPALTVNDLEASLAWYRDVVGFVLEDEMEHEGKVVGAALIAGSTRLYLGQDDGAKGMDRVKGQGFRLHLSTSQDIDQVAANVRARGGTLASEPADMPWGVRAFSVVDPDGFLLTISSVA